MSNIGDFAGHDNTEVEEKQEEKYKPALPQLFDFINSITDGKNDLIRGEQDLSTEQLEKAYPAYAVNKGMSMGMDMILLANEMNRLHGLDNDAQYRYYLLKVRKGKRRNTWAKAAAKDDLNLVAQYYQCNRDIARQFLKLLSTEDLKAIQAKYETGGKSTKSKKKD